jgi:putative hydrolase of the HAD superfamily
MVRTILFDFGGCLDAPGIHSRTLFWDAFLACGLSGPSGREAFQEAYSRADRRMMGNGEAVALAIAEFNRWNCRLIARDLGLDESLCLRAGDVVTEQMRGFLAHSRSALEPLRGKYELGIISNFTGNLEVILREFELRDFFSSVTESYYAGASKPDARIFLAALSRQPNPPEQCLYVGDNPVNDIAPALALGMKAALIHPPGKKHECGAHFYLEDLNDLPSMIQKI